MYITISDAAFSYIWHDNSWTIVYDTIYACQDRRDDIKAGVKSTAVLFRDWIRLILSFFAACFVASLVYAGMITEAGYLYYTITVGGAAACFAWQMLSIDFDDGAQCWQAFKVSLLIQYSYTQHVLTLRLSNTDERYSRWFPYLGWDGSGLRLCSQAHLTMITQQYLRPSFIRVFQYVPMD